MLPTIPDKSGNSRSWTNTTYDEVKNLYQNVKNGQ